MEDSLLDRIPENVKSLPDVKASAEEASYANNSDQLSETKDELKDVQIKKLLSENERYREDTSLRKALATAFTMIISFWLLAVLLILTGNRFHEYNLSDNVLITLLVTTTANVIGMMLIILRNLFPSTETPNGKQ